MQLINSIPLNWRNIIKNNCSSTNLLLLNHHLVKKNNLISLDKLHCQELYNILVYISPHKPTSQIYFENLFRDPDLNWKEIYLVPRKVSLDCYTRSFQYKLLNNVLYLNKKVFIFGKSSSPLCSFCKNVDETILHLFYECDITKALWKSLISFFDKFLNLPFLSPQTAFLGFTNTYYNDTLLKYHILLLFKIYVYYSRKHEKNSLKNLIRNVKKAKNIEKEIAGNNKKKVMLYKGKWLKIENKLNEKCQCH